jgi:hypothetical protein
MKRTLLTIATIGAVIFCASISMCAEPVRADQSDDVIRLEYKIIQLEHRIWKLEKKVGHIHDPLEDPNNEFLPD